MFSKVFIDKLLATVDIVSVIDNIIPLKKTGTIYKALCPFHKEKTPSLVVYPNSQSYHCHGCGGGGNAVTFLMSYNFIDFPQAIIYLCDKYQIPVRRTGKKGTIWETERKKKRRKLRQKNIKK